MGQQLGRGFFWVNLVLGLLVSLFFLIMSGTGVLLPYRPQLEGLLNHWGLTSTPLNPGARPLAIEAVLLFRPGLTGKARDFNWHNVIGVWTLVPLAIMVWSGVALSYPWADRLTRRVTD